MSEKTIVVTGMGIVSPFGRGFTENLNGLLEGRSGIVSKRPLWSNQKLRSQVGGNVEASLYRGEFERKQNRFLSDAALLAGVAMKDAILDSQISEDLVRHPDTGLLMGTGAGSSILDAVKLDQLLKKRGGSKVGAFHVPLIMGSSITANMASIFGVQGHSYTITSACATSAHATMLGMDLIRSGRQKRVFVGGSDDINPLSACAFDGMGALSSAFNNEPEKASRPLDRNRDGFVFSGGGGVLLLEDLQVAKSRGAKIYGVISGAAASCDGEDMVAPNGLGASQAMRNALLDAKLNSEQIDYINLHGTSTPVGDVKELEALRGLFKKKIPYFSSTKSMTGHGLGAAGVMEAIFSLLMIKKKFLAPNINLEEPEDYLKNLPIVKETTEFSVNRILSNSFGFGGTNCSLIFSRFE